MIVADRLALGIDPNSVLSVADMVKCARVAEARGFAATWVAEGRRGDVFALLSALAMSTSTDAGLVLDCACGIGTQALGLARAGYNVEGTDLSRAEIERAKAEAFSRGLD